MFSALRLRSRGWPDDKIDIINSHPIMIDDHYIFNDSIYNILVPIYEYQSTYKWLVKNVDSSFKYIDAKYRNYTPELFDKVMQDLDTLLRAYTKIIKQYRLEEIKAAAKEFE